MSPSAAIVTSRDPRKVRYSQAEFTLPATTADNDNLAAVDVARGKVTYLPACSNDLAMENIRAPKNFTGDLDAII